MGPIQLLLNYPISTTMFFVGGVAVGYFFLAKILAKFGGL